MRRGYGTPCEERMMASRKDAKKIHKAEIIFANLWPSRETKKYSIENRHSYAHHAGQNAQLGTEIRLWGVYTFRAPQLQSLHDEG